MRSAGLAPEEPAARERLEVGARGKDRTEVKGKEDRGTFAERPPHRNKARSDSQVLRSRVATRFDGGNRVSSIDATAGAKTVVTIGLCPMIPLPLERLRTSGGADHPGNTCTEGTEYPRERAP